MDTFFLHSNQSYEKQIFFRLLCNGLTKKVCHDLEIMMTKPKMPTSETTESRPPSVRMPTSSEFTVDPLTTSVCLSRE